MTPGLFLREHEIHGLTPQLEGGFQSVGISKSQPLSHNLYYLVSNSCTHYVAAKLSHGFKVVVHRAPRYPACLLGNFITSDSVVSLRTGDLNRGVKNLLFWVIFIHYLFRLVK